MPPVFEINELAPELWAIENWWDDYEWLEQYVLSREGTFVRNEGCCVNRYSSSYDEQTFSDTNYAFDGLPIHLTIDRYWWNLYDAVWDVLASVANLHGLRTITGGCFAAMVYDQGCGLTPHTDQSDYSTVHFLSRAFEGGGLYFEELDMTVDPLPNRLLVFRGSYMHEALPVTEGRKVSSTQFWKTVLD